MNITLPPKRHLLQALKNAREDAIAYREDCDGCIDVRLQCLADGMWELHTGDPGYDTDHSGAWASDCVDATDTDYELDQCADRLISQCEDNAESSQESE